jgi:hypothetical protein
MRPGKDMSYLSLLFREKPYDEEQCEYLMILVLFPLLIFFVFLGGICNNERLIYSLKYNNSIIK